MAIGVVSIHAMNDRHALGIGLNLEGFVPVSMRRHLLAIEGLNLKNPRFHRLNNVGAIRTVIGQEVEESHNARFAGVQRRPLGRGEGLLALPLLGINNLAEMHAIGRRGESIGGGRREHESQQPPKGGVKNGSLHRVILQCFRF